MRVIKTGMLSVLLFTAMPAAYADLEVSRDDYAEKLHGFWLGQSIANWTGIVTEMDKIGGIAHPWHFLHARKLGQAKHAQLFCSEH